MNKVAVVILNWNGEAYLKVFLPVLSENIPNYAKIYVADNGSNDKSVQYVRENFENIEIIEFDKNYGFAGGYNKALEQIETEYYVLLNSDVEVTKNWLEPIIDFMEQNQDVAVVQPKIKMHADKSKFEYAGAAGGFIDKYGYPFCRGRIFDTIEQDTGQYDNIREIFWASGACFVIRASEYHKHKLDADFFAHMEEIDLCWRIKNTGKKVYYFPNSVVYHVGGGTLPNTSPFKVFLNHRNNLLMLYKNLPKNKLFITIFLRLILDGFSAISYLTKDIKFTVSVFKAHLEFYKFLSKFTAKRRRQITTNQMHKEIYNKSIVFQYFAKKKKYFSQLNFD